MSNGFLIKISNTNAIDQKVQLFSDQLPEGVKVESVDGLYNYVELRQIALGQGFEGNTLTTDANKPVRILIQDGTKSESIELEGRFESERIVIDGNDKYISVICPAHSLFTLRLVTISESYKIKN